MSYEQERDAPSPFDRSFVDPTNDSFQNDALERSRDMPIFEFSSPISSIGSACSSPERERTIQNQALQELTNDLLNDSSEFVSLEELKSQISPPSDDECSGLGSTIKPVDLLETIFEDCYLETPPGTPTTPRLKRPRRLVRMNLSSNFEECKENVQNNLKQLPEDSQWTSHFIPWEYFLKTLINQKKDKDTLCMHVYRLDKWGRRERATIKKERRK